MQAAEWREVWVRVTLPIKQAVRLGLSWEPQGVAVDLNSDRGWGSSCHPDTPRLTPPPHPTHTQKHTCHRQCIPSKAPHERQIRKSQTKNEKAQTTSTWGFVTSFYRLYITQAATALTPSHFSKCQQWCWSWYLEAGGETGPWTHRSIQISETQCILSATREPSFVIRCSITKNTHRWGTNTDKSSNVKIKTAQIVIEKEFSGFSNWKEKKLK